MQEQNLERFYRLEEELRVSNATIVILEKKQKELGVKKTFCSYTPVTESLSVPPTVALDSHVPSTAPSVPPTSSHMIEPTNYPKKNDIFNIKQLPKFSGEIADNFESWVSTSKLLLSKLTGVSSEDKKDLVLLRVQGNARQVLEPEISKFRSPDEIFQCLTLTYGRDLRTIMNNTTQSVQEPVRMYISRLRTNLSLIGIVEVSAPLVVLDYFIKGLLPALGHKVKALLPHNLSDAVSFAVQTEMEFQSTKNHKLPSTLNALEECNTRTPEIPKAILDKLNALQSQVKAGYNQKNVSFQGDKEIGNDNQVRRLESDIHDLKLELSYLQKDVELRKEQEYKHIMDLQVKPTGKTMYPPKNNSGLTCFHCKEKGHRYFECKIASPFQIEHIKANFSSYLAAFKKDLKSGNQSENSNGVASRSSR